MPDTEILILGITFKENCSDIRNSKVKNIIDKLKSYDAKITVVDPIANTKKSEEYFKINIYSEIPSSKKFDAVILAVSHEYFCEITKETWKRILNDEGIILDFKGIIPREVNPLRL